MAPIITLTRGCVCLPACLPVPQMCDCADGYGMMPTPEYIEYKKNGGKPQGYCNAGESTVWHRVWTPGGWGGRGLPCHGAWACICRCMSSQASCLSAHVWLLWCTAT
jgi:hypothetical protein